MPVQPPHPPGNILTQVVQPILRAIGSGFHYVRGFTGTHAGLDLGARAGTPVRAVQSGRVSYARDARTDPNPRAHWAEGGGNVVRIDIDDRYTMGYAHLQTFTVRAGQYVNKGDVIGYVGSTGDATGPHVHLDLLDRTANRMVTSPLTWIARILNATPSDPGAPPPADPGQWLREILGLDPIMSLRRSLTGMTVADLIAKDAKFRTALLEAGISTDPAYRLTFTDTEKFLATPTINPLGTAISDVGANVEATAKGAADILTWATDGAHWLGVIALVAGGLIVWKGFEFTMRGTVPRAPVVAPPV